MNLHQSTGPFRAMQIAGIALAFSLYPSSQALHPLLDTGSRCRSIQHAASNNTIRVLLEQAWTRHSATGHQQKWPVVHRHTKVLRRSEFLLVQTGTRTVGVLPCVCVQAISVVHRHTAVLRPRSEYTDRGRSTAVNDPGHCPLLVGRSSNAPPRAAPRPLRVTPGTDLFF